MLIQKLFVFIKCKLMLVKQLKQFIMNYHIKLVVFGFVRNHLLCLMNCLPYCNNKSCLFSFVNAFGSQATKKIPFSKTKNQVQNLF